jgi:hypothetical protein
METEKVFLIILYISFFSSLLGVGILLSGNFITEKKLDSLNKENQEIKISIPEIAPAVLSGKWKFIK